jgi:membrane fusion protein (multidrug efflux system)
VQAGARVGALWIIDKGVEPGTRIVVEGLQKVRTGVKVAAETVTIDAGDLAKTPAAPGA